uniref:Uncharacterized protein n=1 Tax=Ciona savignyi TaxID=51511 RepID=H2YFC1_CIOSA
MCRGSFNCLLDSPQLSFCLPSQIIEAGSNDHSVSDSSPLKCTNISAQNTESVLCNGTSDGGHVTKDTEPVVNGVQTDCIKEHSSNPCKSNEITLVADSTKDHSLQITIGNKTTISNQVPLQNDKLTYSEINNNRKLSSNVNTNGVTNLNPELSNKSLDSINTDLVLDERTNTENTKSVESSSENKTCVKTDPTNQSKPVTSWA